MKYIFMESVYQIKFYVYYYDHSLYGHDYAIYDDCDRIRIKSSSDLPKESVALIDSYTKKFEDRIYKECDIFLNRELTINDMVELDGIEYKISKLVYRLNGDIVCYINKSIKNVDYVSKHNAEQLLEDIENDKDDNKDIEEENKSIWQRIKEFFK